MKSWYKVMFLTMLILSTMVCISSNNWLGAWMGLEINLLSFIPLLTSHDNIHNEASMKYFMIQAMASATLMMSITLLMLSSSMSSDMMKTNNLISLMINSSLMLKMGAAPLHFWFSELMDSISWLNCFILMTWQKIAPMILVSYNSFGKMEIWMFVMFSMVVGSMGGFNQTSIRKMLAFSSINHIGWMLSIISINESLWIMYILIYSFMSWTIIAQMSDQKSFQIKQLYSSMNENMLSKFLFSLNMFSLGGLPPFLGFLPKWMSIQVLIENNQLVIATVGVFMAMVNLYFYTRISVSSLLLNYKEIKWNLTFNINNNWMVFVMSSINLISLMVYSIFINLY